ncbi:MAG: glycosyltransferase family 4 protein [Bacteroidota bacterium]
MHLLYLQQLLILPKMAGNTRSWEFTQHWHQQGVEVTLITSSATLKQHPDFPSEPDYPLLWKYQGVDIWVIDVDYDHEMSFPKRIISFLYFMWKVLGLAKALSPPDAVLAYTAPLSVAEMGRRLAYKWKCPFFLEVADVWPEVPIGMGIIRHPLLIRWLRKRTDLIYQAAQHIFAFSPDMKQLIQQTHISPTKITTIFNGTKIPNMSESLQFGNASTHPVRFIYAGTLGIANGVGQLIQAFHLLEQRGHEHIRLDIVGDGNDAEQVQALAQELGVRQVSFHQRVPRETLNQFWDQADIGLITFAPFPILESNAATKFFDYLAVGLPVIINYGGWQADYLQKFRCGLSSHQGDIEAFARNMLFLSHNPALRRRMGAEGRLLAQRMFDRSKLAHRMLWEISQQSEQMIDD